MQLTVAGDEAPRQGRPDQGAEVDRERVHASLTRLDRWLREHDYRGYDTFDGLSARVLGPLTFGNTYLRMALQQGVRRFPVNLRPLLGIPMERSTKGMGFIARGYMRMHDVTGDPSWRGLAEDCLAWLIENEAQGYSGACWGNHFDYQSRNGGIPKGVPTIVWTSLIGHVFLDAYDRYGDARYLDTVVSACEHIVKDIDILEEGDGVNFSYIPNSGPNIGLVHNSSTLGASLLARTHARADHPEYLDLATRALRYSARHQLPNGAWYYGEYRNMQWVDNFHTGYVLDSFKHYQDASGDTQFEPNISRGYEYWKANFFLPDGTPKYYDTKTLPLDIQCSSQAIDTLVFFADRDPAAVELASRVAGWTIDHMQDATGYFYYRRYGKRVVNKTPTLHWGQATMLSALAGLYARLSRTAPVGGPA